MRRVSSDAGECFQLLDVSGYSASVFIQYGDSKSLKTKGPIVVSHPFPGFDDIRSFRIGELSEGGKPLEKLGVFGQDSRDLCLLQHDFGNEDTIRVILIPPGQLTSVLPVPANDLGSEQ
jgi:hypothetical protein